MPRLYALHDLFKAFCVAGIKLCTITESIQRGGGNVQHIRPYGARSQEDDVDAQQLQFPCNMLTFTGEQTPHEVAQWMQQSDCFVLFSNYENAPVVLSECLAIGLPIITSNAGGIPEMVNPECGVLLPPQNEEALAHAMLQMLNGEVTYHKDAIRKHANKYTFHHVGAQLAELYHQIVHEL